MNKQNKYSDELISAYIDGELDNDERTQILFDEQENSELAQRINDARMLKEKVQLAYVDSTNLSVNKRTNSCTAFVNRHRALVASFFVFTAMTAMLTFGLSEKNSITVAKQLIANTRPINAEMIDSAVGAKKHIIIHVSQFHPQQFSETFKSIESLLYQRRADESFRVELVANGQGLKVLDTNTSVYAKQLSTLAKKFDGLNIIACAKSLANLTSAGDPIQLMTSIMITPSAAEQVAKRTEQGWSYLKV